jgi:hypothetical protein
MRRLVILIAAIGATSCSTEPEVPQSVVDDNQCQSYGVKPGSPAYVQCRMNLDNQHAADLQQKRALAVQLLAR